MYSLPSSEIGWGRRKCTSPLRKSIDAYGRICNKYCEETREIMHTSTAYEDVPLLRGTQTGARYVIA